MKFCQLLLLLIPTSASFSLASKQCKTCNENAFLARGGSQVRERSSATKESTKVYAVDTESTVSLYEHASAENRPLRVLFLSADTGGGHRASAESLAKQFLLQYPGSTYELADLWTDHGVLPYRTLVNSYKHLSAHPRQWRLFYWLSNNKLNELWTNTHSTFFCGKAIRERIKSFQPDVVVSVHPTMNYCPLRQTRKISKELGKHIPFFTVVTDLGSAHITWFEKNPDKLYVASDRLYKCARRWKGTPEENLVLTGLPIRHGFGVEADKLGDRTSEAGKAYQKSMKESLGIDSSKPMVLVMGGGEGVGGLAEIVDQLYAKLTKQGVDATVCVVCGRNEKLKESVETRDWESVLKDAEAVKGKKKRGLLKVLKRRKKTSKQIEESMKRAEEHANENTAQGNVNVVGLGFIKNMPEYMVAADILVSKAGPGTIAEAASVGLPCMLTSFLPGQEAGNVDVVLESGFGDYCEDPPQIATEVGYWLQDPELMQTMSRAATQAGNPHAADDIVRSIGSQTVSWMNLNEK